MPQALRGSDLSRAIVPLLIALAAVVAGPGAAGAQMDCKPPGAEENQSAPLCYTEPQVSIIPGSVQVSQPSVPVSIEASDYSLDGGNPSSFRVYLDGADVTAQWPVTTTQSGSGTGKKFTLRASGSVALSQVAPRRTLRVRLCDTATQCPAPEAEYTLALPGVQVNGDNQSGIAGESGSVAFEVTNTGTVPATFDVAPGCTGVRTGQSWPCSADQASVTLAAGERRLVWVAYAGFAVPAGTTMSVTLKAVQRGAPGVRDAGWVHMVRGAAFGGAQAAPQVTLVDLNTGATVDRGACVTVATAPRGAYECGDLRLAHALPAQLSRGRAWAPVLLYNSQHATPRPTVYVDVTLPAGGATPDQVQMVVRMGGATYSATFPPADYVPGVPRRMALQWDGAAMATGAYDYTVQVIHVYGATQVASAPVPGVLTVVNRAASQFGAGWWLAGWERLCIGCGPAGAILWIGGDGSTMLYRRAAAGAPWVATPPDGPPDTLAVTATGGYVRRLRGGATVHFDASGRHRRTQNRLQHATVFDVTPGGLLTTVQAPAAGGVTPTWTLLYSDARLQRVDAALLPGGAVRSTSVAYPLGGARVTGITDPDGDGVAFEYDGATARVSAQRDRRGTWTRYTWNGAAKLTGARLLMNGASPSTDDIIQQFTPAEGRSVAQAGTSGPFMDAVVNAYTELDGPRTDVEDRTRLWLAERGAPYRIVDPLGAQTLLLRTDARFPALVTESIGPTGQRTTAGYTSRGTVDTTAVVNPLGDGVNVITRYTWDTRWDAPTSTRTETLNPQTGVRAAVPGTVSHTEYDPLTGHTKWRQDGDDPARRTTFTWYPATHAAAGQLASVRYPAAPAAGLGVAVARDSLVYDARGNLQMTVSPTGLLTLHVRDALGRDSIVYTPVADDATARDPGLLTMHGARQLRFYDRLGRDTMSVSIGPAINHAPNPGVTFTPNPTVQERLTVHTLLDDEGLPLRVTRWATPDTAEVGEQVTEYVYDAAGRKRQEITGGGHLPQLFEYDPAGNLVAWTSGRGLRTTSEYDAVGRLVLRATPPVLYEKAPYCGPAEPCSGTTFPLYPNEGTGYRVPAEWTHFRYDLLGNMVRAENADAIVSRTYYPNGALKTDSLRIRSMDGVDFSGHVYGLRYAYDRAGRVAEVEHPAALAGSSNLDQYAYDAGTGALAGMTDRFGNPFSFRYDVLGRLASIRMPPAGTPVVDSLQYDLEGRLVWRRETTPASSAPLQDERLTYDARGKLVRVQVLPTLRRGGSTYSQWYSGLGSLVATDWSNTGDVQWSREQFVMDALGNMAHSRTYRPGPENPANDYPDFRYGYDFLGRVSSIHKEGYAVGADDTDRQFDAAGNVTVGTQVVESYDLASGVSQRVRAVNSRSYYDADERLRVFQQYETDFSGNKGSGVWEEYRYDPLGRRVLVRTRRENPLCYGDPKTCISSVTRFVWSGDQILWELKDASGSYAADAGGRVSYVHAGGGIDRPLAIWKQGVGTLVTHQNWRGQFAMGTFTSGAPSDCQQYPPSGCVPVNWPGWGTTAWHEKVGTAPTTGYEHYWMGSLAVGMRDASGQMYMRNRYYDPATGQFTQADPIGLAGGLNAYGFAAGDPVTYSDPYGLCPPIRKCLENIVYSHYKFGDMLHAGRHAFWGALQQALGRHANRHQLILAGTVVITREANSLTALRASMGFNDDQQNAFRHIYGSCQLTRMFGEREARETTYAHERTLHERDDNEVADSQADQKNNNVGFAAGTRSNLNHWSCEEIADENIRVGNFWSDQDFR
jgi:RHS repeat-associated protein